MIITKIKWTKEEAGWYTSDLGGICHEVDGWYFYPRTKVNTNKTRVGPYKKLADAIKKVKK